MRLTLEPTDQFETIGGQLCRRWEGSDEDGTPVHAWVQMVQPQTHNEYRLRSFEEKLARLPKDPAAPTIFVTSAPEQFHCPRWPRCGCPDGTVAEDCPGRSLKSMDTEGS